MNQFFNQLVSKASKMIHSEEFKSRNITDPSSFTRNRKLTFPIMTALILNMLSRTMQIELDDFFSNVLNSESVTKQAFFKSRKNIKPEAFKELFEMTRETIFYNKKLRRFKGYRIFAIDGSELRLDKSKANGEYFKSRSNSAGNKTSARISILFDVLSNFVMDAQIGSLEISERTFAVHNLEYFSKRFDNKDIVIFDRGYPSRKIISLLSQINCKYLMRLQRSAFKGVNDNASNDFRINISFKKQSCSVRVIKVTLDSGEIETLITNLSEDEFKAKDFKSLYFMRWSVETAFDTLKNKLLIEKFSGRSPIAVLQEFYAAMFIMNCLAALKLTADRKLRSIKKNCKFLYKANSNLIIGYFKYRIPFLILFPGNAVSVCKQLLKFSLRQPVPVIPNRFSPRPLFSHQRIVFSPKFSI